MTASSSPASSRLVFLDWLRIGAFALLVPYHVGMYFVSWNWHIKSAQIVTALEPWMRLSSPWRMDLLFVISGAATAFMLARGGASAALLGSRARRLLIPLLFGMLVLVPPQSYLEVLDKYPYLGSYADFMRLYLTHYTGFCDRPGHCLMLPTWNHLWFLPYLFFYTLALWGALRAAPTLLDAAARRLPHALRGARLVLIPLLLLAATRWAMFPRWGVTHALFDDAFAHVQYGAMFVLGALFARSGAIWPRLHALRWIGLALALAGWALLVTSLAAGPWRALAFSATQWGGIVAALGFAHRHFNTDNALRGRLTEAVFPVYLLHQSVIILLAHALVPARLTPVIEGPLLVLLTFTLCWLGYEGARRVAWLRPLFGLQALAHPPRVPNQVPPSTIASPSKCHTVSGSPSSSTANATPNIGTQ